MKHTVKLKRYNDIVNEYEAGGAILPGSLVALQADGTVQANADNGAAVATLVALEDALQGKTINESYSQGDRVKCWYVAPGEEVVLVAGSAKSKGDYLTASGAEGYEGQVKDPSPGTPGTSYPDAVLFQATGASFTDEDDNIRVPARRV